MLKVIWLGILILAYSVSKSLQHVSETGEEDDDVQQRYDNLKIINSKGLGKETLGDRLEYFIRHVKAENDSGLPIERSDFVKGHHYERTVTSNNGPKRVKITYKKRTHIRKKPPSKTKNENYNIHEKKFEQGLDDSLNNEDAELLPLLLKYLNKNGSEKNRFDDNIEVETRRLENNTENENKNLRKYNLNYRDWTELEKDSNKVKENEPGDKQVQENGVIGTIYFPNTKLHTELNKKETHNGNSLSEKVTTKEYQVDFPSHDDFSNINTEGGGSKVTTYQWDSNPLDADDKEREVSNTAVRNDLDPSQIDILVKKLCANSKTNFLEFWKLAAGYFGLNHENLSDKQKYDLFLSILKKVNDKKQQNVVELVPSKPENEVYASKVISLQEVIPTENTKKLYWYDNYKPEETQIQKLKLNEEVLFSGSNQKEDGLGSEDILLLNTNKPDKNVDAPIKEAPVKDITGGRNWNNEKLSFDIVKSAETNPDQSPKPLKSSEMLLNYFDSELGPKEEAAISSDRPKLTYGEGSLNNKGHSFDVIKSTDTNPDVFTNSESPQVLISDSNYQTINLTENEDVDSTTSLKPDLENNKKQDDSNEDEEILKTKKIFKENTNQSKHQTTFPQSVHVNFGHIIKEPPEPSTITLPEGRKHDFDKEVINNLLEYLNATNAKKDAIPANNLYITLETKKMSSENIAKEPSGSKKKSLNPIQINKEYQVSGKVLSKDKSLNDLDESESSQEQNSKRLAVLLHYLKTLPKDKLAKIILSIKYNLVQKNNDHNSHWHEVLNYLISLYKSTSESDENYFDKLKILAKLLEDQKKEKEANVLLNSKGYNKLYPNLLLKYNLAPNNKKQTDNYQFVPYSSLDDSTSIWNEYGVDENSRRPKLHLKWNIKLNALTKVLLQILSRFREYGVTDEALHEIIGDLKLDLSENEGKTDCKTQELNKKLNSIMKSFEKLSSLKEKAEAKPKEV